MDEIHVDVVPLLLGNGVRLFDNLAKSVELESLRVIRGPGRNTPWIPRRKVSKRTTVTQ